MELTLRVLPFMSSAWPLSLPSGLVVTFLWAALELVGFALMRSRRLVLAVGDLTPLPPVCTPSLSVSGPPSEAVAESETPEILVLVLVVSLVLLTFDLMLVNCVEASLFFERGELFCEERRVFPLLLPGNTEVLSGIFVFDGGTVCLRGLFKVDFGGCVKVVGDVALIPPVLVATGVNDAFPEVALQLGFKLETGAGVAGAASSLVR